MWRRRGEAEHLGKSGCSLAFLGFAGAEGKREILGTFRIGRKAKLGSCFAVCSKDQPDSVEPRAAVLLVNMSQGFPPPHPNPRGGERIYGKNGTSRLRR